MEDITLSHDGLFAERYRLELRLGKGGMGEVYLVSDTMLDNERVALKVLRSEYAKDEKHIQRFLREVQLTRQVTHPNIVRTFDVGINNGNLYFTMEYVDGRPLGDRIKEGPTDPEHVARILMQVCDGLTAIHERDIVHRDLKPGNIMETNDGQVKIADFGVARPGVSDLTGQDEIVGSGHYMAPEVWVGRDISTPADLYALGVVAYELLTGCLPFDADNPAELMWKHLEEIPVQPVELKIGIPEWLNQLVLALLQKDQDNRPMYASEVRDFIRRSLAGESVLDSSVVFDSPEMQTVIHEGTGSFEPVSGGYEAASSARDPSDSLYDLESELNHEALMESAAKKNPTAELVVGRGSGTVDPNVARIRMKDFHIGSSQSLGLQTRAASARKLREAFERVVGALFFPVLLGALLLGPAVGIVTYAQRVIPYANGTMLTFVFVFLQLFLQASIAVLPLFSIALLRNSLPAALRLVARLVVPLALVLGAFTSVRVGEVLMEESAVRSVRQIAQASHVASRSILSNVIQAGMLSPVGSHFTLRKVQNKKVFVSQRDQAPYKNLSYNSLLGFFVLLLAGLFTTARRKGTEGAKVAFFRLTLLSLAILSVEAVFFSTFSSLFGFGGSELLELKIGFSYVFFEPAGIALGVFHWTAIALGVFLLPLMRGLRKGKGSPSGAVAESLSDDVNTSQE